MGKNTHMIMILAIKVATILLMGSIEYLKHERENNDFIYMKEDGTI
jgi:hypothetical protein